MRNQVMQDGKMEGSQYFSYCTWTGKSFLRVKGAYVTYTSV